MNLHQRSYLYFYICIILTTICMGSSFQLGSTSSQLNTPPMLLGGWRFTIAGFIILLVLFFEKGVKYVPSIDHNSYKGFYICRYNRFLQTAGTMGLLNIAMSLGVSSSMSAVYCLPIHYGWLFLRILY